MKSEWDGALGAVDSKLLRKQVYPIIQLVLSKRGLHTFHLAMNMK